MARPSTAETILAAVTEAASSGSALTDVLYRLAETAREIAGATYAAIGIPEPEDDAFAAFIHVGMDEELVAKLGPLPRTHGMLDTMLRDPTPMRLPDLRRHPTFRGWWPPAHPPMRSFLGVPIVSHGGVIGAFYLTDKKDAPEFTEEDERSIGVLASHAAMAIEATRTFEDSRSLALVEERERMARELHDALNQSLFSLSLTARTAARHMVTDPDQTAKDLEEIVQLTKQAMAELRAVVDGLRTPDVDRDGLVPAIRSLSGLLSRVHRVEVDLVVEGEPTLEDAEEHQLFRIVQEALTNAVRHGHPSQVTVKVASSDGRVEVEVEDDGIGFDPEARAHRGRRLGLTSMRERASAIGGRLSVDSAPGRGTRVRLEIPT